MVATVAALVVVGSFHMGPTELLEQQLPSASVISGCVSPPCAIGGVPAPEVHYSFNQPVTPIEPHPLTLAAVQKAADALAQSQKAGDKEAENRKEIEKANLKIKAVRDRTSANSIHPTAACGRLSVLSKSRSGVTRGAFRL